MSDSVRDTVGFEFNHAVLVAHARRRFLIRLAAATTSIDARALADDAPPAGTPSRPFHDRLNEFLANGLMPFDACEDERAAYRELTARMAAA